MIRMAIYLIVALVLFCGSAAASWFLQKKILNPTVATAETHNKGGHDEEENGSDHADNDAGHDGGADKSHSKSSNEKGADSKGHGTSAKAEAAGAGHGAAASGNGAAADAHGKESKPKAAAHGTTAAAHGASGAKSAKGHGANSAHGSSPASEGNDITNTSLTPDSIPVTPAVINVADSMLPEDVIRFGELMKERERRLTEGEEQLELERQRLNLLKADLQAAKQEIEDMQAKMEGDLTRASEIINRLDKAREAWKKEKEDAEAAKQNVEESKSKIEDNEVTELQELSKLLGNLAPESAATQVEKFVNDGELDRVAKALKFLDDRKAAKILEVISDADVQSRVVSAMAKVTRPPERTARRTR